MKEDRNNQFVMVEKKGFLNKAKRFVSENKAEILGSVIIGTTGLFFGGLAGTAYGYNSGYSKGSKIGKKIGFDSACTEQSKELIRDATEWSINKQIYSDIRSEITSSGLRYMDVMRDDLENIKNNNSFKLYPTSSYDVVNYAIKKEKANTDNNRDA